MTGTIFEVTRAMDRIPPRMTSPTSAARINPNSQPRSAHQEASPPVMPTNCWKLWLAWNMFAPPNEPPMQNTAKTAAHTLPSVASTGPRPARPRDSVHIGPPDTVPSSFSMRYLTPSEHSTNFEAMPRNPASIIHGTAPGPPTDTAIATPAMLPNPTVPESAVASAWKCVTSPACEGSS